MKTHQFYSMKYAVLKNLAELYAEREGEHSVALQYFIQVWILIMNKKWKEKNI